ncbi:MAG: FKBP-type peptidyl-prolyl cis-trans isomerase [Methanomicrobiales archaeon]
MTVAQEGDTVRVHYTGKFEDGTVFGSSLDEDEPLEITVGAGAVIPGVDAALAGMEEGETKTITVSPDEGFGERRDGLVQAIDREQIPEEIEPEVGQQLSVQLQNGETITMTVTDMDENSVTLDANHPLAGHTLTFDLQMIEVESEE